MSGDVQPRKRKDKKKRKDEGDSYGSLSSNEDITIHLHKDGGTGGNICAKIVFFFLFSALIVLVGLIIKENQGLNELDSVEESRFSQIFEGWVDKNVDEHEDHSPERHDHDESNEDEEEYEDQDHSEESDVEEDTDEVQSEEQEEDEDSRPRSEEDDSQEVSSSQRSEDDSGIDEDEDEQNSPEVSEEQNESSDETLQEVADKNQEVDDENSSEEERKSTEAVDAGDEPKTNDLDEDQDAAPDPHDEEQPAKESSGLATKIGVGLALLTVAYNVFLRKRRSDVLEKQITKSAKAEEVEVVSSLTRRNTIVPPPTLQEVEQDLPEAEVEDEEYSEEEYSDEDSHSEHRSPREEYQDLRTTYSRSLTPEGEFEVKDKNYEEELLEDEVDEEEIEPEEIDEDDIDDDYNKYDEDEDEELLKRLEAKYGKLGRDINVGDEVESDSDKDDYEHSGITNKDDVAIKGDIDAAQHELDKGK